MAATNVSNAEIEDMKIKEEPEEEESEEEEEEEGEDENNDEQEQEGEQTQSNFTYRCVICDERFECDTDFHKHRIHHDKCPQCQEVFLCHKELIIHLSLHAIEGNICLFCRKISNTKEAFDAHLNSHRQHFKTLDCLTCGKKLLTSEEFKIHICNGKSDDVGKATGGKTKQPKNGKRSNVTKASEIKPNKKIKIEKEEVEEQDEEEEEEEEDDGDEGGSDDATENLRLADRSDIKIENVGPDDESGEVGVQKVLMSPDGDISPDQIQDIKEENPDKPFKCGYCAIPYAESSQLYYHMTQVHPEKL